MFPESWLSKYFQLLKSSHWWLDLCVNNLQGPVSRVTKAKFKLLPSTRLQSSYTQTCASGPAHLNPEAKPQRTERMHKVWSIHSFKDLPHLVWAGPGDLVSKARSRLPVTGERSSNQRSKVHFLLHSYLLHQITMSL